MNIFPISKFLALIFMKCQCHMLNFYFDVNALQSVALCVINCSTSGTLIYFFERKRGKLVKDVRVRYSKCLKNLRDTHWWLP